LPPGPGFDRPLADLVERAAAAGLDPADLRTHMGGRAPLFHPTDYDVATGERVPLGSGDLDLVACIEATGAGAARGWFTKTGPNPRTST